MDSLYNFINGSGSPIIVVLIVGLLLWFKRYIFRQSGRLKNASDLVKNSITFLIVLIGLIVFITALEYDGKDKILEILGIIISAGIALSSTTILGNLIAGFMIKANSNYNIGDLIVIGEYNGRVQKLGLFHTLIQIEDSNVITIPHLHLATQVVKVMRKSNTVIFTTVSLGYEVSRLQIEAALKRAASSIGLEEPYVYITELGDFSVVYKIHGFLEDSTKYLSTTSKLNGAVMDSLHSEGIEIVSPAFMNQKALKNEQFLPSVNVESPKVKEEESSPEDKVFAETKQAELEHNKKELNKVEESLTKLSEKMSGMSDSETLQKLQSEYSELESKRNELQARMSDDTETE